MVKTTPLRAKVGVIGHPIAHSLSPYLHNPWMERAGITGDYVRIDGGQLGFSATVRACIADNFIGLNVTIPYKHDALAIADVVTDAAQKIGAANLLIFTAEGIVADNTDARGFIAAVTAEKWNLRTDCARVLGAGGAAPAIVYSLQKMGFSRIELTNRTVSKALQISDRFEAVTVLPWDVRDYYLGGVSLLVNTTSMGMEGALPLQFEVGTLPADAAVIDIITTPIETPLLAAAKGRGLRTMNGIPMLVYQAVPSFCAWFDTMPDHPESMVDVVEGLLGARL